MPVYILKATLFLVGLWSCAAFAAGRPPVAFGRWSEADLAALIAAGRRSDAPGERIAEISRHFLATPYAAGTLVGDPRTPEQLIVNLACFDCFTLLDTIEALRRASSAADFPDQLRQVRYRGGLVDYTSRRHFFSDWVDGADALIEDATAAVGPGRARVAVKQLNLRRDGTHWLPGLPVTPREITYIPADRIDRDLLPALQTGDYVGIYTESAGLDVSHVGLIVKGPDGVRLRHASSLPGVQRVVDVDLLEYLQGKPGLVVYRVR
jgi:hypothetical protein